MVIGNGLIASAFLKDYQNDDRFLIFASGVSNSSETNVNEFEREKLLFSKSVLSNPSKHVVYFTSFIDPNKEKMQYADHKCKMEELVKSYKNFYTILKLPQVIGKTGNNNTLVNFIVKKLKNQEELNVYKNVYKSLIDVEDVKGIVDILVKKWNDKNIYVDFPYIEKLTVIDIVNLISNQLNLKSKIVLVESPNYDLPEPSLAVEAILNQLNITPKGYTEKVIKKYVQ
jgi:dTDP-4-dehydrorhamnose reductase